MIRKNLLTLTKIREEKPEDCKDITHKKINKKLSNLVRTKKEN